MTHTTICMWIVLISLQVIGSTIINTPPDISSCTGQNITINWVFNNSDMLSVAIWRFTNESLTQQAILQQIGTGQATTPNGAPFLVESEGNGTIKLTSVTASFTGTYSLDVSYIDTTPQTSDEITVTIYDVPENLTYQIASQNVTCSGSTSIPVVIRVTNSGNTISQNSPYISTNYLEGIECCYNGQAANCSSEKFDAIYGDLHCLTVRNETVTSTQTNDHDLEWWEILCIILGVLIALCIVGIGIFCCKVKPNSCPGEVKSPENDKPDERDIPMTTDNPALNINTPSTKKNPLPSIQKNGSRNQNIGKQ